MSVQKIIPYGRHSINSEDIRSVVRVLRSDWITQGKTVAKFEGELARCCGAHFAVAVSSGTAALHLASQVLGLPPKAEIITSPITFLATSNAVYYVGGKPIFCDIEPDTFNLSPDEVSKKISQKTRAIYPVHFAGLPCHMKAIHSIARKKGLFVVEDASHALGAKYRVDGKWVNVGACRHSDMAVFSFHAVKTITTGEGGAVLTNNRHFYDQLRVLRSHGIHRSEAISRRSGSWYYEMRGLGFNYRLTDIQAALGLSQLKRLPQFIARRREIASLYCRFLKNIDAISLPREPEGFYHAYHLFVLSVNFTKLKKSRTEFMKALAARGIGTQVHYIPVYKQPYYRKKGADRSCPEAERYYAAALSLPIFPSLSNAQVRKTADAVKALCLR